MDRFNEMLCVFIPACDSREKLGDFRLKCGLICYELFCVKLTFFGKIPIRHNDSEK